MSNEGAGIGISVERLRESADDLAACAKRLRYSSACLGSDIDRLRESGAVQHEYLSRLARQRDLLESDIQKTEMMTSVLTRVAREAELTENAVLDHEDNVSRTYGKAEVHDLTRVSGLLDEVMKQV
ncbi:MAG: hypothetical protein IJH41_03655 [Eubacterium sp.]|nr:hypothetical protein [Eubacterium sp.]